MTVKSSDEIGALGADFNRMALSLEQQRKTIVEAKRKMEYLVLHDGLTGLPNRSYLQRQIPRYLAISKRHASRSALMLMDIDQFKSVNDSFGHDDGDELLVVISRRLQKVIRGADFVARLGGDEFIILSSEISSDADRALDQIDRVVASLLARISEPINIDNTEIRVTVSIGIVFFPGQGHQFEKIMKNADTAMYRAKEEGSNRSCYFDLHMQQLRGKKSQVLRTLKDAMVGDQLRVYYQPEVNSDGKFVGAEALLRWEHSQYGLILPQDFVKAIENNSLIIDLSQWVLETVCTQYQDLRERHASKSSFTISVNISSNQFHQVNFVEQIIQTLSRHEFPSHCLILEITESVLLRNTQDTRHRINRLKHYGIRISIDDFGTGYSSLTYLKNLELDEINMDCPFVRDIFASERDRELANAIITMSQSLNMNLVAEGVENRQQFEFSKVQRCPMFQGCFFEETMVLARFQNYLGSL